MSTLPYPDPVSHLLNVGDPIDESEWPNYLLQYDLSSTHIPDLIRMALDEELYTSEPELGEIWAPMHAWRALGQLGAVEAVQPLLTLLHHSDDDYNEWVSEDLPVAIGLIGPAAIPALADYIAGDNYGPIARMVAVASLVEIAKLRPETGAECAAAIARTLAWFEENDETMNAELIAALAELRRPETYSLVDQAFQAQKVDFSILGDWEDFQIDVGLLDKRITPMPMQGFFPTNFMAGRTNSDQHKSHTQEDKKVKDRRKQEKQSRKKNRKKKK